MAQDDLAVAECTRCSELVDSRTRIVNGVGPADAEIILVGEAPGEREDAEGEPFVGRSGEILNDVLRDAGLDRTVVRITNTVRCRPPDNRDPTAEERSNCRPHLDAEIDAVDPSVIVTLGKVPSENLLERSVAVTNEAGTVESVSIGETVRDVMVCVHPAATLYDRSQRGTLEQTIVEAAAIAGNPSGDQTSLGEF
ncbi:uracil-DNA glycosylase [Halanaeroarchaeum sulfurireducens]|uniref:Type-4 uracil-DNA glycosylase n=1 Tax=Halanaeroarchaeum sulfurireducens TaxID=1604004 RepID=A0A0F7PFZ1_9EURY|nr:uracil-DNA glycosylase [Halanaeroarchaeum sulfurireducens]AKH98469.1 phage SPO1 DNA polymerase-related protein [Halanaeroarchaeum sulfurireducens]ALG82863.1 phage SPO1 DNA polymerase-related protein [Halanaeroarchaeum sulfurireducens]